VLLVASRELVLPSLVRLQVAPLLPLLRLKHLLKELEMDKFRTLALPVSLELRELVRLTLPRTTDRLLSKPPAQPLPTVKQTRELQVPKLLSKVPRAPQDSRLLSKDSRRPNRDSRLVSNKDRLVSNRDRLVSSRDRLVNNRDNKLDSKTANSRDSRLLRMVLPRLMATNSREATVPLPDSSLKARHRVARTSNNRQAMAARTTKYRTLVLD
jgi:hypothetical protein